MVSKASERLNIGEKQARVLLRKYRGEFRSSVLGLEKYHNINPKEFYVSVYDSIDISTIEAYPDLDKRISRLANKYTLHLLTNSNLTHAKRVLRKLNLQSLFKNIFSVEFSNFIRKPNAEVYEKVITHLMPQKDEVLNIDDSYLNLDEARKHGFKTGLVSNGISEPPLFWEMHAQVLHEAPDFLDYSAHKINDLIDILL